MRDGDCKNCDFWSGPSWEEWAKQRKILGHGIDLHCWELNLIGTCRRFPQVVEKRGSEACGEYRGGTQNIWSKHDTSVSAASDNSMHNWKTVSWSDTAQAEDQKRSIAAEKKLKAVRRELRELKAKMKAAT
jgi:beta-galactosidase GanA